MSYLLEKYGSEIFVPDKKPAPANVARGEFKIAAVGLEHNHIYGMCSGLKDAGADIKWVYDRDEGKVADFIKRYPEAMPARSEDEILSDPEVKLVCSADITSERCGHGIRAMRAGKDFFSDKAPMTTLAQLDEARRTVAETGRKYMVYYSERLHSEASVYAGQLISRGAIGRVLQTIGMGPHRENPPRPDWFYIKEKYGGILCDIGSHQIEQFLFYTGAENAAVVNSHTANYAHPEHPELDDFGYANLVGDNGPSGYFRIDWFTPRGLSTWGDGRMFILGTDGYIELRKYCNVGTREGGGQVFLVDGDGEHHFNVSGDVGYPYFPELINDCINRTETAMSQKHALLAAELCIRAQMMSTRIEG
ncbi:MAG: Gfo/Idh/MocA family oxidoreductase [Firmicutes bacterium]|nr:Gfo/Idh/MocA family oxidoreductase [Bacillota bacterium]